MFGIYVWANYQRLEHYLLVPWLMLALGVAVSIERAAEALGAGLATAGRSDRRAGRSPASSSVGSPSSARSFLSGPAGPTRIAAPTTPARRSFPTVFAALPQDAVILSEFDASTPLWHGQHVRGQRPDVLIVDDTNMMYEGWGTREARIASVVCERPVFIIRMNDIDLLPTRASYELTPFLTVDVGVGDPSATTERDIHRVEPLPGTCDG